MAHRAPGAKRQNRTQYGCYSVIMQNGNQVTTVQARGVLVIPAAVRRRHRLEPGTQVEVVEREDGVIELHPVVTVPATQAWFWTERWQRLEAEAEQQIVRGELTVHETAEDLLSHLDAIADNA